MRLQCTPRCQRGVHCVALRPETKYKFIGEVRAEKDDELAIQIADLRENACKIEKR